MAPEKHSSCKKTGKGKPMNIRDMIENRQSVAGRRFDLAIQTLIVLSIVMFCIETLPDLNEGVRQFLRYGEVVIVLIFTVEYLARIAAARQKLKYVFSFFGIVDLLAILPFYLMSGIDLRSVRIFRLLRLLRMLKLLRYSQTIARLSRAVEIARDELILFAFATGMMLFISAVGIYYFENEAQPEAFASIFHSLWWAVTTLTTVGYGDMYPVTAGGRVFSFVVLMIGLGIVAVPAGLMASALSKARLEEDRREKQ